jgi:hypothetical protein
MTEFISANSFIVKETILNAKIFRVKKTTFTKPYSILFKM